MTNMIICVFALFMLNATWGVHAFIRPSLRNIITNNAIITTLFKEVNKELLDETNIITDLNCIENPSTIENHVENTLVGISFYSLLFTFGLIYENTTSANKLQKLEMYKTYTKKTRTLLLILILVFNRHIENAI